MRRIKRVLPGALVLAVCFNLVQVPSVTAAVPATIQLSPASPTGMVGTDITLTATVLDGDGNPFPGQLVNFRVHGTLFASPGVCVPESCVSDSAGTVQFSHGVRLRGEERVVACFSFEGRGSCDEVDVTWRSPYGLSVNDVQVVEGDAGTTLAVFTVSLNQPRSSDTSFSFGTTVGGTAAAGQDYVHRSLGNLVHIRAGQSSATFAVEIIGDVVKEPDETVHVYIEDFEVEIADGSGVATILDDERDGAFSCRASAVRVGGFEPAVANASNAPCIDDNRTLPSVAVTTAGLVSTNSGRVTVTTDQTPDNLESSAPALTDKAVAVASVDKVTLSALGLVNIVATGVRSESTVQCAGIASLKPIFTTSSSIGSLTVNGLPVATTGSSTVLLPAGLGSIQINRTASSATAATRSALRILVLGVEIVVAESRANFSGNPCTQ